MLDERIAVWTWLVRPAHEVEASERSSAQLLAGLLLVVVVLGLASTVVQLAVIDGFGSTFLRIMPTIGVLGGMYAVSRTRHWRVAAAVAALAPVGATALTVIDHPDDRVWYAFMMIGVLVGATFLSLRAAIVIGAIAFATVLALVVAVPELHQPALSVPPIAFHVVFTPMLMLAAAHRERVAREREAALRASELRAARLIEEAPDAMFSLDVTGTVLDCNPATERISGIPRAELVGRRWHELGAVDPKATSDLAVRFSQLVEGGPSALLVSRISRRDGSEAWVESIGRIVGSPGGVRIEVIMRDVTERVRADLERGELQRQLEQARRLETIGQLAGGVAHDFNNLLTVMLFNLTALHARHKDEPELAEIQAAAERAAGLTRNLLAFARRQVLHPEVVELNSILRGVESILRKLAGANIELAMRLADDLGVVEADPTQLEQVAVNLVANARDAMPRGGAIVITTANRTIDGLDSVELTVRDTGVGMDAETVERVFEPFYTTKSAGTGLGLATVYGIVKQSGGKLMVESTPGQGSVFHVQLPRVERRRAKRPTQRSAAEHRNATVLLIEDDLALRRASEAALRTAGFTVLTADTGRAALRLHEQHRDQIDIIVTDVVLPELTGPEIVASIARPELPVVFISGYAGDAVRDHGAALTTRLLQKPFTPAQLIDTVRATLAPPEP